MAVTNKLEAIGRGGVCRDSEDGAFVPNDSPLNYFHSLGSRFQRAFECIQSAIMHNARSFLMKSRCLALFAFFAAFATHAAEIPQSTIIRFNTACARCHEGQCSGRLSFALDHTAAASHIRRYAGEVTVTAQKDLHTLLAYMKQHCAYYPMRAAAPQNGGWDQETLAQLRNHTDDMHFIPLGTLVAGRYRARLRFAATAEACAQVISSSFDIGEYPGLKTEGREMEFEFMVDASLPMYLRLQTARPAILEGLEILPLR